jgi:DNA replication protein DnaC
VLNEPTIEKLKVLRLEGLLAAWAQQQKDPNVSALGFDERLGMLIDAEWIGRENKRISRSLKEAKLRITDACIEGIEYPAKRELDKAILRQLQTCRWVEEHQSVLITGATGTGKSYIACALANQACRK